MSGFIGDLLEGIAGFVTDVWLLRRQRAARNRPRNGWARDATDVAFFDAWVIGVSILTLAATAILLFGLNLPLWISLAPVVVGAVYVIYRWMALARA
ncbi:hypothetical protein ACLB90_00055 [Stenotrophomonas sp. LGBM10]|uniref:hypothetical protein n=1 Tax=Stenotrophomonas sp. LGBM10 TaxID=3390038 RepID=UPI00398AB79C